MFALRDMINATHIIRFAHLGIGIKKLIFSSNNKVFIP